MLNAMRQGAKSGILKFFLLGLMALAVGGLVMTDVGGFFTGGSGVSTNTVVKIGKTELPITVFDQKVRRIINQQGIDIDTAYRLGFIQRILHSEINEKILQYEAYELGLHVPNYYIANRIKEIVKPRMAEGVSEQDAFRNFLRNQGLSENQFTNMLKAQISTTLLRGIINAGNTPTTQQEAIALYKFNNEERQVSYLHFPHSRIQKVIEAPEEALSALYEASKYRHAIPETRNFKVGLIKTNDLMEKLQITEDMKKSYYDEFVSEGYFDRDKRRSFKQALFESEAEASKFFQLISEQPKDSAVNMDEIAAKGGLPDIITSDLTEEASAVREELRSAIFTAEIGDVVPPIQSVLGWHVIKVTNSIPEQTLPFKDVSDIIEAELRVDFENQQAEQLFNQINDIDEAIENGDKIANVADSITMTVLEVEGINASGKLKDDKAPLKDFTEAERREIIAAAFTLEDGQTSGALELEDNKFVIVEITDVTPLSYKSYEDVKPKIIAQWKNDQKAAENKLKTEALLKDLLAGSKPEGQFKKVKLVRNAPAKDPITDDLKSRLYESYVGDYIMGETAKGYTIARVDSIKLPEAPTAEEALVEVKASVTDTTQKEIYEMFMRSLHDNHKVDINEDLLERHYGGDKDL